MVVVTEGSGLRVSAGGQQRCQGGSRDRGAKGWVMASPEQPGYCPQGQAAKPA